VSDGLVTHRGGCHCGAIAFEVEAPARVTVSECNCSIPDGYTVNLRCLDQSTLAEVTIEPFDDRDRGASEARIRHLSRS